MKNKKNIIISVGIALIVVMLLSFTSPNIIGRLLGNINSVEKDNNELTNDKVVIDTKLVHDNQTIQNGITLKIYNGNNSSITINNYIYQENKVGSCDLKTHTNCNFTTVNIENPVEVDPDSNAEYIIPESEKLFSDSNSIINVGVQYTLDDKTYNLYTVTTYSKEDFDKISLNQIRQEEPKEFTFNSTSNEEGKDDIHVKLSDYDVYMDKSESLNKIGLTYSVRSAFTNKWYFEHPQTTYSLGLGENNDMKMFGEENDANIDEYFDFDTVSGNLFGTPNSDYDDTHKFTLEGTPKGECQNNCDKKDIKLGFYFMEYKDCATEDNGKPIKPSLDTTFNLYGCKDPVPTKPGRYAYWSDLNTDNKHGKFSTAEKPHFNLTVYDKSNLQQAIKNAIEKLASSNEEEVSYDSWLGLFNRVYTESYSMYKQSDNYKKCSDDLCQSTTDVNITQSEIDNVINELNSYTIEKKQLADYTKYNELSNIIENLNEDWYLQGYQELKEVYNQKNDYINLSISYQTKLDNYVKKLQEKFDALQLKDADYAKVEEAKKQASEITNKTEDEKYDLYTDESWQLLQDALDSIEENLKINEQEKVDSFADAIKNAIDGLEIAPAKYGELDDLISSYINSDAYSNNWYTPETKQVVDDYINQTITDDKKITDQSIVDGWKEELQKLINKLKLKKANGYLDSDNYHPFDGALSLEAYVRYLKTLNEKIYTEDTMHKVNEYLSKYEDIKEENKITIDKQEEMDSLLEELHNFITKDLEKKPGDYTKLCDVYAKALELNLDYYEDIKDLQQALWDIDWNLKADEQSKIDEQTKKLQEVMDNLVMKDADYDELIELIESAESLNFNYYVDVTKLKDALKKAKEARNYKIDKQDEVDKAAKNLKQAIDDLILKDADYSKIEYLKSVIEQLDKNKYTNFDEVEKALKNIVYGKKINQQSLVDDMYKNLKKAYDNLKKTKADYTELNKALEKAKTYEEHKSWYSNWNEIQKLVDIVDYNLTWEDQDKVNDLTKKINDAISNLKKKNADYTKLSDALSKIPNDYSNYSESLKKEIDDLLKKVKDLPANLTFEEQSRIDELTKKANDIISKLNNNNNGNKTNSAEIIISYLKVNGVKVDISKAPFKHTVDYDVSTAKILVGLVSKDSTSKIYGGKVLVPGDNNITIIVTTKDGNIYTYTLVITRPFTSNYLKDLNVKDNEIEFSKTKQEYTIKIDKSVNKLDLSAIAEDENAKVTVKGNNNIKNGSKVTIEVKSSDGNVRVYTLNIQKAGSVDIRIIIILIMVLAVIAGIFKYIEERKKLSNA